MKKRDLAGWGALVGGVAGYFAESKNPVLQQPFGQGGFFQDMGNKLVVAAEGAAVGGLLGFLFGGKK